MASLKLEHIYKVYPNGTKAVNDISLDIKNGEFIVFVGPSGCGKSTTLRMIAGLEDISSGELYIDNDIVNDVEPKDRDIAMVFQNYALYPHMSVYENMAFGLRLRHVPEDVIQEKVLWASDILGLKEYLDRKPRAMSGGQRQRVALGRAILRDPKVMLLDEPLSNLDAKLRTQMRSEIAKLHQKLKTTFIYVTHDQTEAMTLGDRVVVMKKGRIQQVDTPKNLYRYPANQFVASFIGTPQMNFFAVTLKKEGEKVRIHFVKEEKEMCVDSALFAKVLPSYLNGDKEVVFGIRCENVRVSDKDENSLPVMISHFEELGSESLIYGNLANEEGESIIIKEKEISNMNPQDVISVSFDMEKAYFFDKETENSILLRIPQYNCLPCTIKGKTFALFDKEYSLPFIEKEGVEEAEIHIPCDAFLFNKDGIPSTLIKEEEIQDQKLLTLDVKGKTLFALKGEGEEYSSFDLDVSKVTIVTKAGEVLYKPMEKYDSYSFYFYNYPTIMKEENNPLFASLLKERVEKVEKEYQEKLSLLDKEYEKKKEEISTLASSYSEKEKEYLYIKEANEQKIKEILSSKKEEEKRLKEEYSLNKKKAKEENDALFLKKKEIEEKEYNEFKKKNQDKEALKRRSDEYHIFKDSYHTEKENALLRSVKTLSLNYEAALSSLKATDKRNILLLRKEIDAKKKEALIAKDPLSYLKKEQNEKVRVLLSEKKQALIKANCLFFIKLDNGYTLVSLDKISNKLIQGLSSRVFEKEFRLDVRHDAYTLVKEGGFEAKVEEIITLSNQNYLKCTYLDSSHNTHFFIIRSEEKKEVGETIRVTFSLENTRITLRDMNIRLY